MVKLGLGIDLKDFDLEKVGFSISVLDETGKKRVSEGYLRMTLVELDIFLRALKAAKGEIHTATVEADGLRKFMSNGAIPIGQREPSRNSSGNPQDDEVVPKLPIGKSLQAAE